MALEFKMVFFSSLRTGDRFTARPDNPRECEVVDTFPSSSYRYVGDDRKFTMKHDAEVWVPDLSKATQNSAEFTG